MGFLFFLFRGFSSLGKVVGVINVETSCCTLSDGVREIMIAQATDELILSYPCLLIAAQQQAVDPHR